MWTIWQTILTCQFYERTVALLHGALGKFCTTGLSQETSELCSVFEYEVYDTFRTPGERFEPTSGTPAP